MKKIEFMLALERALAPMTPEERSARLEYYNELFADMLDEGMTEEEICAKLGNPGDIARELLQDLPLTTLIRSRVKTGRERVKSGWQTVLNVLGAPLWLVLLLAALAVILSVYVAAWSVVIFL